MNDRGIVRPNMEELYQAYFTSVYNYVFYRLLRREDTEDVVSRIFIKVVSNLDRYDDSKASIRTWIFRIADNVLIDFYRRRRQMVSIDDEDSGLENTLAVDFDTQYNAIESPDRRALYQALTRLSERERAFIYYRYFENITNREIARRLNMNESTVAAILARARTKLKEILKEEI